MKVLSPQEIASVSGGFSQTYTATTMGLCLVTMAVIYSFLPKHCEDVIVYTDVITPLYDAYGQHYADKIDTYEEVKRVCK